jgi:trehalose 6-phosphate synthase/phosphatase
MPEKSRKQRNSIIQNRLKIYNEEKWANDIIKSLENVKKLQEVNLTRKMSHRQQKQSLRKYRRFIKRIIFLDYDGTLTGFHKDPHG